MRSPLIPILALILAALANPALGDSVEDFYKGRTITVLIGYSPQISRTIPISTVTA